jgi:excisionase family DNA binding protein
MAISWGCAHEFFGKTALASWKPIHEDTNRDADALAYAYGEHPRETDVGESGMLRAPLLTLHEAAEKLKVKESTIRQWIKDRELRAIKFGREWRIAQIDLEAFLNQHANMPPQTDMPRPPPQPPADPPAKAVGKPAGKPAGNADDEPAEAVGS